MLNMSYYRFRNTLADLDDCYDNMDAGLNGEEFKARNKLIDLCHRIASNYDKGEFTEPCDECARTLAPDGTCRVCDHVCDSLCNNKTCPLVETNPA